MANYVLYKLITIKNRNSVTKATTNEIVLQGHVTYNNQSNSRNIDLFPWSGRVFVYTGSDGPGAVA